MPLNCGFFASKFYHINNYSSLEKAMSDITPNVVVSMPSQLFTLARKFQAASNGKIFIGKIDTDPTLPENQIQVYLENEDGSHIPVTQPLIINQAGFPVYNGQISKFVTVKGHSMAVYDSYGVKQFYYPNLLKYDPDLFEKRLKEELASNSGASMIGTDDGRTVQERLSIDNDSANYRARNIAKLAFIDEQVHTRGNIKVLFQGDSMTAGFDRFSTDINPPSGEDWASHAKMIFPDRFAEFIEQQSGCVVTKKIRAISGYTSQDAYLINQNWQTNPDADIAVLMYGINDSTKLTIDQYINYMEKLIRRFIDWGMGVVVCLPAVGGQGTWDPVYQKWAKRIRMISSIYGCAYFNANEISYYRHNGAIQSDATHFNSMGYAICGEKLASMFMAGGLLTTYRPVNNEITTWCGRIDDSISFCNATNNIDLSRNDAAFTRTKIVGAMQNGKDSLMSFSFYLDADAAHIYAKISGTVRCTMNNGVFWNNKAQKHYDYALSQDISYSTDSEMNAHTIGAGDDISVGGTNPFNAAKKYIGRIVGKGWHTISFHKTSASVGIGLVNSLTVQPVPVGYSIEKYGGTKVEKRVKSAYSLKIPSMYNAEKNGLPGEQPLQSFTIRCPQSLMPSNGDMNPYFANSGHAVIRISNHNNNGEYFEGVIIKTVSSGYDFKVIPLKTTYASDKEPIITAKLVTPLKNMLVSKASNGAQPIEDIFDYSGNMTPITKSGPSPNGGLFLQFDIDWRTVDKKGYWNIEVESSDVYGSSEVFIGA